VYRWFRDEAIVNQHIFKVIPSGYPAWLVFDRLEEVIDVFRGIAKDKATTMGHIQRGHLESTTVRIPSDAEVRSLDETMDLLWQRLLLADREILSLAGLRDTLLLKLMSEPQAERVERDVVEVPA
jgi:type I restriction enzyme S subunit